jgi:AhpD family alkylhydroperoxidase
MAQRPPALRHVMGLLAELADEARIPKRIFEIPLVAVSRLNVCRYCVAHHAPRLAETGLAPETIAAILDDDCPGLDAAERLVRDYAVQVTTRAAALDDKLFAALRARFDDAQMVELTLRIGLCSFFNRFNDALRIEIEDDAMVALLASGVDADALPAAGAAE